MLRTLLLCVLAAGLTAQTRPELNDGEFHGDAPYLLEELWALCGRRLADDVELRPMDPFYRIRFDDGSWFDYSGDPEHMKREVARFCPSDLPGYERFLAEAAD